MGSTSKGREGKREGRKAGKGGERGREVEGKGKGRLRHGFLGGRGGVDAPALGFYFDSNTKNRHVWSITKRQ